MCLTGVTYQGSAASPTSIPALSAGLLPCRRTAEEHSQPRSLRKSPAFERPASNWGPISTRLLLPTGRWSKPSTAAILRFPAEQGWKCPRFGHAKTACSDSMSLKWDENFPKWEVFGIASPCRRCKHTNDYKVNRAYTQVTQGRKRKSGSWQPQAEVIFPFGFRQFAHQDLTFPITAVEKDIQSQQGELFFHFKQDAGSQNYVGALKAEASLQHSCCPTPS